MNANRGSFSGRQTFAAETAVRQKKPLGRLVPNPKLKFLDQCREVMRFKQLSHRTEKRIYSGFGGLSCFIAERPLAARTE
jgi:hypothetical protein